MSANYHLPTDEELCDKQIATILKLYKMDRPLPKHIKDDIDRVLDNIGWSCWFVDYLNHRIYCWVLEITANRSNPELEEFVYWEDIPDSDSEDEEEECVYVIKTWEYNRQKKTIEYKGLWEKYGGDKEFKTEQEARDEFDDLTQNGYGIAAANITKIDPNSNEDRETIIEEYEWGAILDSDSDEDDKCKSCGWRSEYPESHILYCGGSGCEYIRDKYKTWITEDGELEWKLKDEGEEVIDRLAEDEFNLKNGK
jgi:hypothetical protein